MDAETEKLCGDLSEALGVLMRAGDWVQNNLGLSHRGYVAYENATEGIEELLSLMKRN